MAEYAVIAALVAGVSTLAVTSFGTETRDLFLRLSSLDQPSDPGGSIVVPPPPSVPVPDPDPDPGPPPPPGPGPNFGITIGSATLPQAICGLPWSYDFSQHVALTDAGTITLADLEYLLIDRPSFMGPSGYFFGGIASGTPDATALFDFEVYVELYDYDTWSVIASDQTSFSLTVVPDNVQVHEITTGTGFGCAVTTSSSATRGVHCWGWNSGGRLGDGTTISRSIPVPVRDQANNRLSGVQQVAAGAGFVCARLDSGNVTCWGDNTEGQLGLGDTANTADRRRAGQLVQNVDGTPLSGVASISAGGNVACAVLTSGQLRCWGRNDFGSAFSPRPGLLGTDLFRTGDPLAVTRARPVVVPVLDMNGNVTTSAGQPVLEPVTGIASVFVGREDAVETICATDTSGGLRCWGHGGFGRLSNGARGYRLVSGSVVANTSNLSIFPQNVVTNASLTPLTGVSAAMVGAGHGCAIVTGGEVRCWGLNNMGQLGIGNTTNSAFPAIVLDSAGTAPLAGVTSLTTTSTSDAATTCASLSSGGVKCWGSAANGRLGNNTTTPSRSLPVDVLEFGTLLPLGGIASVSAGSSAVCARTNLGGAKCWGFQGNGALGDGVTSTTNRTTARDVLWCN